PGYTLACPGGAATCSVTVRDGVAPMNLDAGYTTTNVSVGQVRVGAFGQGPEPLAFVALYLAGGDVLGNRRGAIPAYYLFRHGDDRRLRLVARSDETLVNGTGIDAVRSGVFVRGDSLVLGGDIFAPDDPECCPSMSGEVALEVRGGRLVPDGAVRRWPIGEAPEIPAPGAGWEVLLDRIGPIAYGEPLPDAFSAPEASGEGCQEVQPPEAPYGLTLLVREGAVVAARMAGPNWRTRSDVGTYDSAGRPLEIYGARRISDAAFDAWTGALYTPSNPNPNRIGFVVRDGRVAEMLGGAQATVEAGGECPKVSDVQETEEATIRDVDFGNFTYRDYPLCEANSAYVDLLPCEDGSITFTDGSASQRGEYEYEYAFAGTDGVVYTDVDGDGREDALLTHEFEITFGNNTVPGSLVVAYAGAPGSARQIGHVHTSEYRPDLESAIDEDLFWYPSATAKSDGTVEASILAGAPRARPPYKVTATYVFRDGRFRLASRPRVGPSNL
ncbi:MAG: hypothetical protein AAFQ43_08395, partial [Bacteroidota bacterium]